MATHVDRDAVEIGDVANVLLLAPAIGPHEDDACAHLLERGASADAAVLSITLTQSPDRRIEFWRSRFADPPAEAAIVAGSEVTRSTSGESIDVRPSGWEGGDVRIDTVNGPSDLTGIGINVTEHLTRWRDRDHGIVMCFHSLTALLQYVDLKRAYRFLHVLTERVRQADAVGHFHLASDAFDARTVSTLTTLFDAVVEIDDDGEWTVSRR